MIFLDESLLNENSSSMSAIENMNYELELMKFLHESQTQFTNLYRSIIERNNQLASLYITEGAVNMEEISIINEGIIGDFFTAVINFIKGLLKKIGEIFSSFIKWITGGDKSSSSSSSKTTKIEPVDTSRLDKISDRVKKQSDDMEKALEDLNSIAKSFETKFAYYEFPNFKANIKEISDELKTNLVEIVEKEFGDVTDFIRKIENEDDKTIKQINDNLSSINVVKELFDEIDIDAETEAEGLEKLKEMIRGKQITRTLVGFDVNDCREFEETIQTITICSEEIKKAKVAIESKLQNSIRELEKIKNKELKNINIVEKYVNILKRSETILTSILVTILSMIKEYRDSRTPVINAFKSYNSKADNLVKGISFKVPDGKGGMKKVVCQSKEDFDKMMDNKDAILVF